ncbi:MAG: DUF2384 domain-containing protein [Rhizobiaceae bacterium]|nr:DUF2384 domain-containing protein [Rhizobiaceae bacterium]
MNVAVRGVSNHVAFAAELLGGERLLNRKLETSRDAHDLLLEGLPAKSFNHLVDNLTTIERSGSLERVVGMSLRTFQRRKDPSSPPLSREQSGRTWKFAEILARAIDIFGSSEEAERWLDQPAMGLDGMRPIDLLETPAGVEMVEQHLGRLRYGVYM